MKEIDNLIDYNDNLIEHSCTHDWHLIILQLVLDRLQKTNLKKCHFGSPTVAYRPTNSSLAYLSIAIPLNISSFKQQIQIFNSYLTKLTETTIASTKQVTLTKTI